jgi:hypothetical protein
MTLRLGKAREIEPLPPPLRRHFRAVLQDAAVLLAGSGLRSAAESFSSR